LSSGACVQSHSTVDANCLALDPTCSYCLFCANKLKPQGLRCV
jgi:hypothetical protein